MYYDCPCTTTVHVLRLPMYYDCPCTTTVHVRLSMCDCPWMKSCTWMGSRMSLILKNFNVVNPVLLVIHRQDKPEVVVCETNCTASTLGEHTCTFAVQTLNGYVSSKTSHGTHAWTSFCWYERHQRVWAYGKVPDDKISDAVCLLKCLTLHRSYLVSGQGDEMLGNCCLLEKCNAQTPTHTQACTPAPTNIINKLTNRIMHSVFVTQVTPIEIHHRTHS